MTRRKASQFQFTKKDTTIIIIENYEYINLLPMFTKFFENYIFILRLLRLTTSCKKTIESLSVELHTKRFMCYPDAIN